MRQRKFVVRSWGMALLAGLVVSQSAAGFCIAAGQSGGQAPHHSQVRASSAEGPLPNLHDKGVPIMNGSQFSEEEGKYLLRVARSTIENELFQRGEPSDVDEDAPPSCRSSNRGTFVTLTKDGDLRGCIGHIIPQGNVLDGIKENAINAAFRDPRFQPVSSGEWERVKVEVSILTRPEPLEYTDAQDLLHKIRPGVDGVILKQGFHQATFLPQVWEQLPRKEDFLTHLCMKAGLDADAWQRGGLEISTYQVQAFEEE